MREKPDIIFLMTDQQRWDALGVEQPFVRTPNLDRLAREGIRFRQAVCQAPMCIPSRNSMMFGLYPSQLGVRSNFDHGINDSHMPHDPLPEQLRKAGYQTAGFGKTHWGHTTCEKSTRGFGIRVAGAREVGVEVGAGPYQDEDDPEGLTAYRREVQDFGDGEEGVSGLVGGASSVPSRQHRDGWVAGQCLRFLKSGVDPDRPLFLYLSFLKPHAGHNPPPEFEALYDLDEIPDTPLPPWPEEPNTHLRMSDEQSTFHRERYLAWRTAWEAMTVEERRQATLRYYANCSWLDDYFGQVLQRLEKVGRLDNALIVFVSDHGEMLGERHHRFTKYCLYDSSVRVPLILAGSTIPRAKRGTIDHRPAELIDLMPTLQAVSGAHHQDSAKLPGLDLLRENARHGAFCEYHDGGTPAWMWRTKDWKLILFSRTPTGTNQSTLEGELYNLREDPHEWHNLYDAPDWMEMREGLKSQLLAHLAASFGEYPVRPTS